MAKALKEVEQKIGMVDVVIEVRDARVPLASGNPSIQEMIRGKPHLIVLNKMNLAEKAVCGQWRNWFARQQQAAFFVDALRPQTMKKVVRHCRDMAEQRWKKTKAKGINPPPLRLLIVGIPNTGKSTIINRLTRRNAARTGDRPGVTKHQEWIVLANDLELLDTPGIMQPRIETEEQGMWLCAIHAIKDEIIGQEQVATFVVEHLAALNSLLLKKRYQISDLSQGTGELLLHIGQRLNYKKQKGEIDLLKTCNQVLLDFRKGLLGPCSFEIPPSLI